jgi:hypothetical protein
MTREAQEKLVVSVEFRDAAMVAALQAWRFQHNIPPLAATIRELVKLGLGTRDEPRKGGDE